jgi:glycosyltransferase involved in cell wall biosynthesis
MRTAAVLHYLAENYQLDAVLFRDPGSPDPRRAVPHGLLNETLLIDLPFHSKTFPLRAARNLGRWWRKVPPLVDRFSGFDPAIERFVKGKRYNVAVIEHFWCARYRTVLGEFCDAIILDLHNIESLLHHRSAQVEAWPLSWLHHRFAAACRRLEAERLLEFDVILTASEIDRNIATAICPAAIARVYPNTIPVREFSKPAPRNQIVFSGNLAYHPNLAALAWFFASIWPALSRRHPGLECVLVGKNPESVRGLAASQPGIRLTGEVEDALPELSASLAAVVPLRSGSGTRVKILEAWAAGVPVVSTTIGAEGLPVLHGEHLLIADGPEEFASAVSMLIGSEVQRAGLRQGGRKLLEEKFTWQAGWKILNQLGI